MIDGEGRRRGAIRICTKAIGVELFESSPFGEEKERRRRAKRRYGVDGQIPEDPVVWATEKKAPCRKSPWRLGGWEDIERANSVGEKQGAQIPQWGGNGDIRNDGEGPYRQHPVGKARKKHPERTVEEMGKTKTGRIQGKLDPRGKVHTPKHGVKSREKDGAAMMTVLPME